MPDLDAVAEEYGIEWAESYARNYWTFGMEPKSQLALAVLLRELEQVREWYADS